MSLLGGSKKKSMKEKLIAEDLEDPYARTNTFTEKQDFRSNTGNSEFARKSTFSRAFTFDTEAFAKTVSTPFEGLSRTLTEVGNKVDPDLAFTKAAIREYVKVAESGPEGDVPLPSGFARKPPFWKLMFLNGIVAVIMGVLGAAFMNMTDEVPKQWATCDYDGNADCGNWYTGHKYFLLVPSATGMCIGIFRWGFSFPDNLPGLFFEIQQCKVHWEWSPMTYLISAMSLAGGASLGPEAALVATGGGIGNMVADYFGFEHPYEDYNKLMVLSGMSSALGALFPTPVLSAMMIHELGEPPRSYMESTLVMSIASCIAFGVFYEMIGVTFLDKLSPDGINLSYQWEINAGGYKSWMWLSGVVIGIISAGLCLLVLLFIGITKQIFGRIRQRLAAKPFLKEVLPPTLAGVAIGAINWALPGTVGNGQLTITWVIKYGAQNVIPEKLLLCTGFARAFLLGISMNSGFIGGFIFPFLSMGSIAGVICYRYYPYIPLGMCVGTFMFSIPCGIVPLPFTFTCLSCFVFYFGTYETVPVFISILVSYILVCGSGLMKKLGSQARDGNDKTPTDVEAENKEIKEKEEAEQFALKQYLGNKASTSNSIASH